MSTNIKELELVKENVKLILDFKQKYLLDPESSIVIDDFEKVISNILPSFYNNYPVLCKMVIKNDDLDMLYMMIEKIIGVESGKEKMDDVKTDIGEKLAEKYLYPKFGKPNKK